MSPRESILTGKGPQSIGDEAEGGEALAQLGGEEGGIEQDKADSFVLEGLRERPQEGGSQTHSPELAPYPQEDDPPQAAVSDDAPEPEGEAERPAFAVAGDGAKRVRGGGDVGAEPPQLEGDHGARQSLDAFFLGLVDEGEKEAPGLVEAETDIEVARQEFVDFLRLGAQAARGPSPPSGRRTSWRS